MKTLFLRLAAATAFALALACGSDSEPAPPQNTAVSGVQLNSRMFQMSIGEAKTLTALVMPSGAANKGVTWVSDNASVADVTGSGSEVAVTAHAAGEATITVRTADGGHTDACRVLVDDGVVHVAGVTLDKVAMSLVPPGLGILTAMVQPSNAANQGVSWDTSNAAVATVKGEGATAFVTAVVNGTATITATTRDGGITATCIVTVGSYSVPLTAVSLNRAAMDIFPGGSRRIAATLHPFNAANQSVTWGTDNPGVATVAGSGLTAMVTAVGAGFANITVTADGGRTATCAVSVGDKQTVMQATSAIVTGTTYSLAFKSDGSLWSWGNNVSGQLGIGTNGSATNQGAPVPVGKDTDWVVLSAGNAHIAAVKTDGSLWTWGYNNYGQQGVGTSGTAITRNLPLPMGTEKDWATVSAGYGYTVAIKTDGSLWSWGRNYEGSLGVGDATTRNQLIPAQVGTDYDWKTVSASYAGGYNTVALKTDGSLWSWGYNDYGQLGVGDYVSRTAPTRVGTENHWVAISAGEQHVLALKNDGSLWSWGRNDYGQQGSGGYGQWSSPRMVGADSDWAAISGGGWHSLALKKDGSLWVWGENNRGQLGIGDNTRRAIPIRLGTENNWVVVAAGESHTMGLKSDGSLWTWGINTYGQLGIGSIGDSTNKNTPVMVGTGYRVPAK